MRMLPRIDSVPLLLECPDTVAFSTRRGTAVADDSYSDFNVCHYTGDNPAHVAVCRRRLADALGIPAGNIIIPRQTHSSEVLVVDSLPVSDSDLQGKDALVTDMEGVALCINTADCIPVVLFDPERRIIGAVHSGWRGTVAGISVKTVECMVRMGAGAAAIHAAMGPCICRGCFEVGEEVADAFRERFPEEGIVFPSVPRPHIDLAEAVRRTLMEAGVRRENISMPGFCSRCAPDEFFSARAAGIESGRTLTLVMMRPQR